MQTIVHIDKSGRVVIPKEMRDELGLTPDRSLVAQNTGEGVLLKPAVAQGRMVDAGNGIMVYHTDGPPVDFDIGELIDQGRAERQAQILASWKTKHD
jgi:AbrB family looped-hinge helix DNA binding protein